MIATNHDFVARAEALGERWRTLLLEQDALLAEAWDCDIDVRALRRALIARRRGSGESESTARSSVTRPGLSSIPR